MSVNSPVDNVYVFDFGQNVAGMAQLRVPGNAYHGRNLTMIHSEQVNKMCTVDQIYGKGKELATYTLRDHGNVPTRSYIRCMSQMRLSWCPQMTFDDIGSTEFGPASSSNAQLLNRIESTRRYS